MVYICTKFHENIFNGADTIFIEKLLKGHHSLKNVGSVTVLFLYTSSDGGLYCFKVS